MAMATPQEKAAFKIAQILVDGFNDLQTGKSAPINWLNSQRSALICAKEMMKWYKKGFDVVGADHSHKDTTGYQILNQLPKEIRKYKID